MEREAYFDNAKLLLIFLVVFGHVIQPFTIDSPGVNTLYMWIYTFHMPAFIFLAGFFAKGSGNKEYIVKLAKKLLVPYIIFQLIYTSYYFLIGKSGFQADVFYPHWSLWFLLSLFCWHLLLSIFKRIPAPIGIALSVVIGIVVGYFGEIGHQFSLSRTFVFFPFFLIGYWVTKDHVFWLKRKSVKIISVMTMVVVAVAIYLAPELNTGWLLASKSYGDLGLPEYGGLARFLVYATSSLMAISVLAWIPLKQFQWTKLGQRTLYVYLLHGFIVQYFRKEELFYVNGIFDLLGLAAISVAIVFLLSSKPVQGISQPFIECKASIMRKYVSSVK
ncbi:acyltransferase family protein [Ornithinibacillus halophilus]|nr:acyltransferase family protein [Ornithinibacillus halophilus]